MKIIFILSISICANVYSINRPLQMIKNMSNITKSILTIILFIILGIAGYIFKHAWYERYVWPDDIPSVQDLPPEDRSQWQKPPLKWTEETVDVEVATPDGLKIKPIHYYTNSIGMDFVKINAATYIQNSGWSSTGDKKRLRRRHDWFINGRQVTITKPFYLSAFEVTNAEYELFDPSHQQRRPKYQQKTDGYMHPVEPITWREAVQYARWLSKKEGRQYRLPTFGEWLLAAKAGTTTRLYWGESWWDRSMANLGGLHSVKESYKEDLYLQTSPVGYYPANPWGLYDMIGNSYEWVSDWWHLTGMKTVTDPQGPKTGKLRMAAGGGWTTRPYATYISETDGNNPADLRDFRGFRLLVEAEK